MSTTPEPDLLRETEEWLAERGPYNSEYTDSLIRRLATRLQPAAHQPAVHQPADEPLPWNEISREKALARWVMQDYEAYGLHLDTAKLVRTFAGALADKLHQAEKKYGYSNGWKDSGWEVECQAKLVEHLAKGDPRDVAAYAAFCWFHKWSTAAEAHQPAAPAWSALGQVEVLPPPAPTLDPEPDRALRERFYAAWAKMFEPSPICEPMVREAFMTGWNSRPQQSGLAK